MSAVFLIFYIYIYIRVYTFVYEKVIFYERTRRIFFILYKIKSCEILMIYFTKIYAYNMIYIMRKLNYIYIPSL